MNSLEDFDLDLSSAVGSDFAAIIPCVHKASGREYVLKMQKVWPPGEEREVDEWGNPVVFASHIEQGKHEYEALHNLQPCAQVCRVAAEFESTELEPPDVAEDDEEYEMGLSPSPDEAHRRTHTHTQRERETRAHTHRTALRLFIPSSLSSISSMTFVVVL